MPAAHLTCARLVGLIGWPATRLLAERFGGVSIYLPHPTRAKESKDVARVIGLEALRKLASAWPQERVVVPRLRQFQRNNFYTAIRRDKKTLSVRQLALKYRLTERYIYRILARQAEAEEDDVQPKAGTL